MPKLVAALTSLALGGLACVIFPAAHARGALQFAEWATIDTVGNTASGSIGPVAVTFRGNDVSGGVTDNSFTGFNNAYFAPPLPASDSVNFVTTLSRYIYTITFAPAVTDPRLHLFSHASVLNFVGTTPTKLSGQDSLVVDGNRVIGALNSSPTGLTDANGTVQLNGTFTSVTFTAENFFGNDENVLQIGADVGPNSIHYSGDSGLTVISMPSVIELSGDLILTNNPNLIDINFGGLTTVGGNVDISGNTSATTIDMSALTTVTGDVDINGNTSFGEVDLSSLTSVGHVTISDNTSATTIDMSALTTVTGDVDISGNTSATTIDMSALTTVTGDVDINGNTSFGEVDLSSLTSVGHVTISDNTSATTIDMSALTTVTGDVDISGNTSATTITASSLGSVGGDVTLSGNAGGVTLGRDITVAGTFLNNGPYIQSAGIAVLHNLDGGGDTTVSAGAKLTADRIRQDSLTLEGTATIRKSGDVAALTADATSTLNSLTLTPTAKLDLANNAVIVDFPAAGPNPEATLRERIISGRGGSGLGKTWNGLGITSSQAAADPVNSTSVGYAFNGSLPLGKYDTFGGQAVDATTVLMAYTRTGDANLDGIVNNDDVTIVGANYAPGFAKPHWALGDFDYNGFVDNDDVTLLGVFYNPSAAPIAAPAAGSSRGTVAVPEPASIVMLAIGTLAFALSRVHRSRKPPAPPGDRR